MNCFRYVEEILVGEKVLAEVCVLCHSEGISELAIRRG
jgi:hypothetical protein